MSVNEKMTAIADAIRSKIGGSEKLTLDAIAAKVDAVHEAGKEAEYDTFWKEVQAWGNRKYMPYAFAGTSWSDKTFKPKYDIIVTNGNSLFRQCYIGDLKGILEAQGVVLDTSANTIAASMFAYSTIKRVPKLDLTKVTTAANAAQLFSNNANSTHLEYIEEIKVSENTKFNSSNSFSNCCGLTHVIFSGVLGQNGLNVSWSPLDHESLMSIINCLQTKTSGTWTVTLGTTNLAKLTDAEKAIATQKGWTLV